MPTLPPVANSTTFSFFLPFRPRPGVGIGTGAQFSASRHASCSVGATFSSSVLPVASAIE